MKPEDILDMVLNYSEYEKGGKYSASDILSEPLRVKLKKKYPNLDDVKPIDKVASVIGTGFHEMAEKAMEAENAFNDTGIRTEVKLKFNNISGTADLIFPDGTIGDYKTSKEATLKKTISNPIKWQEQLSIYALLNHKENGVKYGTKGYIFWVAVDTRKTGMLEVELLPKSETISLIKEFLTEMDIPIEETKKCKDCSWLYKWCSSRSVCSYYNNDDTVIDW